MSTLDFLFSNKPPQTLLSPSITETNIPGWYQDVAKAQILKANQIAAEPYQTYRAPRIAEPSATSQRALGFAENAYNPQDFQKFLSPYIGGVVDRIGELGNRNLFENILPNVQSKFTSAGQPFSMREGEFTNRAIRDTQGEILGAQSGALQSAYDAAMKNWMTSVPQQYSMLSSAGDYQTNVAQRSLDLAYEDFQRQRDYPLQQLDVIQSIMKGYSPLAQLSATKTAYSPTTYGAQASPAAQIGGALSGL